ncbi:isoprenyl transferase [Alkaliphilus hydrothermalis]|uniref:Isoprenyl transferase n=1 Tax=Alkaliphilus hydrothermalis TaxID=1482730 RepID=A0ABS2NL76_9FIRM|nr:isoprenyl transferase [Alkaliphilus hydrothermalis]MBM7613695.1 undecaprenyl diphosphate synthase [Alkaliphilus hydrothermalis]
MIEVDDSMDIKKFFTGKEKIDKEFKTSLNPEKIPQHIAIIMDGNGRWAQKRQLPRALGHRAGGEALRGVIETAASIGVKYLSLYAFSTENWSRPESEVTAIMQLLVEFLKKEAMELHENNVKIHTMGDLSRLPGNLDKEVERVMDITKDNTGLVVNIALNYGGRDELLRAFKKIHQDISNGKLTVNHIDESLISNYLDTATIPDPELLIRTSGEFRLSNFMIWQLSYTEFTFPEKYWPDFKGEDLIQAIIDYQNRDRRFGKV